jgi:pimeloyl-ACP methyl ester carboxylesterase
VRPWSIDPALVGAMVDLTDRRQANPDASRALAQAARSLSRDHTSPESYRRIVRGVTQPALVVHGWHDRLVPVTFARLAVREHPNWNLMVYPDLGHIPMMEAPGRFAASVLAWLDRTTETDSVTA